MAKLQVFAVAVAAAVALLGGSERLGVSGERRIPVVFSTDAFSTDSERPSLVSADTPACATGSSLGEVCEEDPEYNDKIKQHALALLRQDTSVNSLLSNPSLRSLLSDSERPSTVEDISVRFGSTVSENPVCDAQETIVYPKRAKTPQKNWVFVLNQEGVQQALRVEQCIKDGSSCKIGHVLPGGVQATCRQKYVYRRMLVVGSNKIEPEEVLMPSCCVCYTTHQDLFLRTGNSSLLEQAAFDSTAPEAAASQPEGHALPITLKFNRSMRGRQPFIRFPGNPGP